MPKAPTAQVQHRDAEVGRYQDEHESREFDAGHTWPDDGGAAVQPVIGAAGGMLGGRIVVEVPREQSAMDLTVKYALSLSVLNNRH